MSTGPGWPIWVTVLFCGAAVQLVKLAAYSAARRRLTLGVLGQGHGLPGLPPALLGCLLVLVSLRRGWNSAEAGFALVFAVIVVHDAVKLGAAHRRQRQALFHLVDALDEPGPFRLRVADYLDPASHHPAHVAAGVLFGALFALAFGLPPR